MSRAACLFAISVLGFSACRFGYEVQPDGSGSGTGAAGGIGGTVASGGNGGGTSGGDGGAATQCIDWWDDSLRFRRELTFQNESASSSLSDFTVLVVLTPQNFSYANAAPLGADLHFVDADNGAPLPHHIDTWNEGSTSTLWVRVPEIEANNADRIWMYYGGADASAESPQQSYDNDFRAVWHLGESDGEFDDSSGSSAPMTSVGSGTGSPGVVGRIGLGILVAGAGDGALSSGGELDGLGDHTITAWVRPDAGDGGEVRQTIFSAEEHTTVPFPGPGMFYSRSSRQVGTWINNGYRFSGQAANRLLLGEWAFVALRANASATDGYVEMKVNGGAWETVYTGDASTAAVVTGARVQVGTWLGPSSADFWGNIDEVQVSSGLRSDDWVDAQYHSQANLSFITFGSQESCE